MEDLSRLREIIEGSRRIVFFGGAGVSTESGIPDFRSESGLYAARQQYGHSPEELLSHRVLAQEPELFFRYYHQNMLHPTARPNPAHLALARLEQRGRLAAVVTQNIDGLHQSAGSRVVHELHGSVHRNYCVDCGKDFGLDYVLASATTVPRCDACTGMVRPQVVLYGEGLDTRTLTAAARAIQSADTLIVGGTSLAVYPAAGLVDYFGGRNLVLINKTSTGYDSRAQLVIHGPIGQVLGAVVD